MTRRFLDSFQRTALIAVLLCGAGAQWALLQLGAWTLMGAAGRKDPCHLCLTVERGAASETGGLAAPTARLDLIADRFEFAFKAPAVEEVAAGAATDPLDALSSIELPPPRPSA